MSNEPVAWMVYTQDGQSCYVTDNPADISPTQRALPLYTDPVPTDEALLRQALDALAYWLEHGETPGSHDIIQRTHDVLQERLKWPAAPSPSASAPRPA
jgi:hypothetical protein